MATGHVVTAGTTFDGRVEFDHSRRFAPLPTGGNLVVGVTEAETIYLWRGTEWQDDPSRRRLFDDDKVAMLLVLNPATTARRHIRVFSCDGLVPNDRVSRLACMMSFNPENSIWRVAPEETVPEEAWLKLNKALREACSEFVFNKFVDAVASPKTSRRDRPHGA